MGKDRIYQFRLKQGFALPTVLITSVVMLTVLLASLAATSSISAGLKSQYINQLSDEAAQSGMTMARACMEGNKGAVLWTNDKPLKPNTDCTGAETASCPITSTAAACYVLKSGNFRTTFKVGVATDSSDEATGVESYGIVREVRKTSGDVLRETSQSVKLKLKGGSLTWKQISVGSGHTCAIASDNKAYCWGSNSSGQLGDGTTTNRTAPVAVSRGAMPSGTTIRAIGVGGTHTCAIASDGYAYCWGANTGGSWSGSLGKLGNNVSTAMQATTPVAVYRGDSAALGGKTVLSMSVGANHTCVIASDSNAYCWGDNGYVQLGDGTSTSRSVPVAVKRTGVLAGKTIRQISAGLFNTCVTASDNKVYCWGYGNSGNVMNGNGAGATTTAYEAVAVSQGTMPVGATIRSIGTSSGSTSQMCVIASDNKAYCWGSNYSGELGDGTVIQRTTPVTVSGGAMSNNDVRSIVVSSGITCMIAYDTNAYCWGSNSSGQLGNGASGGASSASVAVRTGSFGGKAIRSISSGGSSTCAIVSDGSAYCWGSNSSGQLGNGTSGGTSNVPVAVTAVPVSGSVTTNSIVSGGDHTCAVASDNNAYCWGGDVDPYCELDPVTYDYIPCDHPILGNGTADRSSSPVAVSVAAGGLEGKAVIALSASDNQTCALASDYRGYCWGFGVTSSSSYSASPVLVGSGLSTLRAIGAGLYHTCAIANNNKVYCWGSNGGANGKLGNNSTASTWTSSFVAVAQGAMPAGATVRQLSVGSNHTCVIASDNNAYCWGANDYDQLGDNTYVPKTVPTRVSDGALAGKTIRQISAGYHHTCVIASDNKAYCWGANYGGALGNGSTTSFFAVPVAVSGGYSFASISAGDGGACGITLDNKAYCWGYGTYGKLGNGATGNSTVPVLVTGFPSGVTLMSIAKTTSGSTCAISSDYKTYCWGGNAYGQLGNGTTGNSLTPSVVQPFPSQKSFSTPGYIY